METEHHGDRYQPVTTQFSQLCDTFCDTEDVLCLISMNLTGHVLLYMYHIATNHFKSQSERSPSPGNYFTSQVHEQRLVNSNDNIAKL